MTRYLLPTPPIGQTVRLCTSLLVGLSCCAPALAQVSPFGVCAHLGGGEEFNDREAELSLMEAAGIRSARADFTWGYFEQGDGNWVFDNYDTVVRDARRHGVTLLPILCYNVDWAFPAHDHLDQWCDYVRTVVNRYRGELRYWEVWNEPNIGFWRPEPNAEQYTRLLKATYETIKAVDPELQVVYGGTAGIPFDYLRKTFEQGACDAFDVLAVHPYRYPTAPEPGKLDEDLLKTRDLLREFGGNQPIWITEMGWPTHENKVTGDGTYLGRLIAYAAQQRFPGRERLTVNVLQIPGYQGSAALADIVATGLRRIPGLTVQWLDLGDLATLDPAQVQVLVMPTSEWYPADYLEQLQWFVREGGLLVHVGGVPFYYAGKQDADGKWTEAPFAGETGREAFHVGWKAWWTQEGLPESAEETRSLVPAEAGVELPHGVPSTRWLTDTRLQGNDRMVPLVEARHNGELVGYPVALYLFDSDLKGGFLSVCLDVNQNGVTESREAELLPRAYLVSLASGVEMYAWYEFRDGGDDASYNEHRFGIIHHDMTVKAAYLAYQVMTQALGEARFIERLNLGEDVWGLVFDTGAGKTVCVWKPGNAETVRLRVRGDAVGAMNHLGERLALSRTGDQLELVAGESVTYLTGVDEVTVVP